MNEQERSMYGPDLPDVFESKFVRVNSDKAPYVKNLHILHMSNPHDSSIQDDVLGSRTR